MKAAAKPNYSEMFHTLPFKRIANENPGATTKEVIAAYTRYLNSISMIDPTPINDVVGWLTRRMTNKIVLDAIIAIYGDRGKGKSYASLYLAERLDMRLARVFGTEPGTYFTVDNLRSVDKSGTLKMLTPKVMKEKPFYQIYILDDASISSNARNFQSQYNKNLNDIMTTSRIYRSCIIMNTVHAGLIDSVPRSYADIGILVDGLIPGTDINQCRVFRMTHSNHMGFGKGTKEAIGKLFRLTFNGEVHRMKTWYTGKPSDELCAAYDIIRKENTDKLGDEDEDEVVLSSSRKRKVSRKAERKQMIDTYYADVIKLYQGAPNGKPNISSIGREVGITREWVNAMLAEQKRRERTNNG